MYDKHPIKIKYPIARFIYNLANTVEIYTDYISDVPLNSIRGKVLTMMWEKLLSISLWLYRKHI